MEGEMKCEKCGNNLNVEWQQACYADGEPSRELIEAFAARCHLCGNQNTCLNGWNTHDIVPNLKTGRKRIFLLFKAASGSILLGDAADVSCCLVPGWYWREVDLPEFKL